MTPLRNAVRTGLRHLPPRMELSLRVARSTRSLGGFYAPGTALSELVPKGKVAIDAGANVGVYSYWIAKSASEVIAFEPQPILAKRLTRNGVRNLRVHNIGLSDSDGTAELHIPRAHGEASMKSLDGRVDTIEVPLATLDSFHLTNVGFLKVDVEGYEEPLMHGAAKTLRSNDAAVYIELEERHNPGGIGRMVEWLSEIGYSDIRYRQFGEMHPYNQFDVERDQLLQKPLTPGYANNFLFRKSSH